MEREKQQLTIEQMRESVSNQALGTFRNEIREFERAFTVMVKFYPNEANRYSGKRFEPSYGVLYHEQFIEDKRKSDFNGYVRVFEYNPLGETRTVIGKERLDNLTILNENERKRVEEYYKSLDSAFC